MFLVLAVAFAALAIYMFRLAYWVRSAVIFLIALGLLFAVIGIFAAWPHPDLMELAWQLFVIAVDAWILWYLTMPHVKAAFAAQRHHPSARIQAHT